VDRSEHAKFVARARRRKLPAITAADGTAEVVGSVADRMRESLVPLFHEPWDARHPVTDLLTGRRIGKSEYICRLVFRGAWENPKSTNPLILPTAKQARLALWPILMRVRNEYFPDSRINDTEMRVYLPEGGTITCGGCEHNEDVGKWFGIPFEEACIDECGNFKSHLSKLHHDAIRPGTMDFRGRITRSGNPGIAMIGPWWNWTGPNRKANTALYVGDARQNPYIKDVQGYFGEVLEENGWTESTATFVRLYLGKWALDPGALVYPWDRERNGVIELPTVTETGDRVDPRFWRYILGMDIGYVDATTYVVAAVHPAVRELYYAHAEGHSEWTDDVKIERAAELRARFGDAKVVIDPGGGGKNVIVTLTQGRPGREPISATAAKKTDKPAAIRMVRDGLLAGTVKTLPDAEPLVDEWNVLGWDLHKVQHDPNAADHYSDAALYAYRDAHHHEFTPDMHRPPPQYGTEEYHNAYMRRLYADFERWEEQENGLYRRGRNRYGGGLLQ
jgi:hypothetical protein